jgi:hypothetical protein
VVNHDKEIIKLWEEIENLKKREGSARDYPEGNLAN